MDYETSAEENRMKTILSEYKPTNYTITSYDRPDKDDSNLLFMTIEDLRENGFVDNFLKENLTD